MKILCVFAFILLAFSFAGCGGNDECDVIDSPLAYLEARKEIL